VWWHAPSCKWEALVTKDSKRHYVGLFANEVDAAIARDVAARILHGEFARLNFPD
jgi:hypothetical protein